MIFNALGWVGTVLYLGNHAYLSFHRSHDPRVYFGLNFVAALALVISSSVISSWQAAATNLFWALVSLFAISRITFTHRFSLSEFWITTPIIIGGLLGVAYSVLKYATGMTILGWSAGALFCAAYLLFTTGTIDRVRFLLYNIVAATSIMPVLYIHENWPVFALEIAWIAVSAFGLVQIRNKLNPTAS